MLPALARLRPFAGKSPPNAARDLYDLRGELLSPVLVASGVLAVVVLLLPDPLMRSGATWTDPVALCVLAGLAAAFPFRGRRRDLAAALLLAGLLAAAFVGLPLFPAVLVAPCCALLVVLASTLLGKRGAFAAALAASLGLWLLPAAAQALGAELQRGFVLLVWGAFGLSWLTTQPLRTALDWSWSSYEHAVAKTKEAERHRGELASALKALGQANHRLEVVNAELERARLAAAAARDLKARFAAFVSHELRLPLNIVLGFSEMMVTSPRSYRGQELPAAYRADVEAIYRAAYHLSTLVDDVLDLSEIDAHQMSLEKEWCDLGQVLREAADVTAGLFAARGLTVAVEPPPELPPVYADKVRVRQIVVNLLKNAARFTDQGGATVSARVEGSDVVISVADTGIGIPAADLPHVFDEFRQLESAGQRRWGGSGLGLTISKKFAEMHGGNMWVESQMGRGTTFRLSLPLMTNVAAVPGRDEWDTWVRPVGAPDGAGPTVGLIAPDRRVGRLLRRHLERCRVVDVAGPDALPRVLDETPLHALIVARSADADAGSCADPPRAAELDAFCAEHPDLPVIGCELSADAATEPGVVDYLVKPVDRARLAGALARFERLERAVVVDDDAEMARLLAAMLRAVAPACRVWEAHDAEAALAAIARHRPDVVLLDLVMPGVDGHEVIRRLHGRRRGSHVPAIVVVSAGVPGQEAARTRVTAIRRGRGLTTTELVRCLNAVTAALATPAAVAPSPAPLPEPAAARSPVTT